MKIVSKQEAIERIKKTYPNQDFELLEYSGVTKPVTIKCLKCFKESKKATFASSLKNKNLCECYSSSNKVKHQENKKKILELISQNDNKDFISFGFREKTKKHVVKIKCLKCKRDFEKTLQDGLKSLNCPYCESSNYLDEELFKKRLGENYNLLSPYISTEEKVLLKHNECGFIWWVRPHNIKSLNGGCPKCHKKRSKGERKIESYLIDKNINFEIEKNFPWLSNQRYHYDFYLNDFSLVIEYMGQQHYIETSFCKDTLAERQQRDQLKKEESILNGLNYLAISYKDFDNIEAILNKWFNDYSERK